MPRAHHHDLDGRLHDHCPECNLINNVRATRDIDAVALKGRSNHDAAAGRSLLGRALLEVTDG